jgi:cell wall-associated NlpC family hydrolase
VALAGRRAAVITFVKARIGCGYTWGGTGPCSAGYDCSGLAMEGWAAAGVTIARTSQEQWAAGPQVPASKVRPADEVFFPGGDGTWSAPGHVGIVVDPAKHLMINAYARGTPVRYATYGPGAAPGSGLDQVVGFTDPAAQGGS